MGDAQDLVYLGTPHSVIASVGAVEAAFGFLCWHKLGHGLGLARLDANQKLRMIATLAGGITIIAVLETLLSSRL